MPIPLQRRPLAPKTGMAAPGPRQNTGANGSRVNILEPAAQGSGQLGAGSTALGGMNVGGAQGSLLGKPNVASGALGSLAGQQVQPGGVGGQFGPAAAAGAADAAGEGAGGDTKSELQQMYEDMQAKAEAGWGNTETLMQANSAALQRRAMAMQGAMGSAIGGGFAGALGQAGLQGNLDMLGARQEHENAMNALRERGAQAGESQRRYDEQFGWDKQKYADAEARSEAELAGEERANWSENEIINALQAGEITPEEAQKLIDAKRKGAQDENKLDIAAEMQANTDLNGDGHIGAPPAAGVPDMQLLRQAVSQNRYRNF